MVKNKLKTVGFGIVATALIAAAPAAALAKTNNGNSNAHNKITICHATGSTTNPFVKITPDANGVVSGHESHQDTRDIIPPFTYNDHGTTKSFAGQNWDTSGRAIFNNGCVVTGGQGGGPGGNNGGQVLGTTTTAQVQTPQGGVGAGFGGASVKSNPAAIVGLGGSLLSLGTGLALFNRKNS